MIRAIFLRQIDAAERRLGESMDYARFIARTSVGAFLRLAMLAPLASYRKKLPADVYRVARLVATRDEDCGTCVQIEVNLAREEQVAPEILRAVLSDQPADLPDYLADVYRFAKAVVESDEPTAAPLRERLRERYGDEGLIELSLGIAACRVYPITKRALGYGATCAMVKII